MWKADSDLSRQDNYELGEIQGHFNGRMEMYNDILCGKRIDMYEEECRCQNAEAKVRARAIQ